MFLDIGIGILAGMATGRLFDVEPAGLFVLAGIVFALLPDLDFLFYLIRQGPAGKDAHKHRDLLHYPLLYIPVGILLCAPFGFAWVALFAACSLAHFIHDSIGIGWGVKWLYPFSRMHFSFLYMYHPKGRPQLPRKWFYAWSEAELEILNQKYGDPDWIKNIYLKWHPYAIFEFVVFLGALVLWYLYR